MAKRDAHYAGQNYESDYPSQEDMIHKRCEVCGADMVVNNWPDKKSRTPTIKGVVVCPNCDPRHPVDRYMKEGYRILHPTRLRMVHMTMCARALARYGCLRGREEGLYLDNCKCAGCTAKKLFKN